MKKISLSVMFASAFLFAQAPVAGAPKADAGAQMMIMMVVMFAILWFFMIRPEQKKQKAKEAMRKAITKGDKVITIGGICGTIVKEFDDRFVIQTTKETSVTVLKVAVDRKDMTEAEIAAEREPQK